MTLEMDQVRHLCIGLMSSRIIKILHLRISGIITTVWLFLKQYGPYFLKKVLLTQGVLVTRHITQ